MKILVCGDAMEDMYWTGSVSRISPEAPVPVVSVTHEDNRAGGAANVANTIEAMGVQCERLFGWSVEPIRKIRVRTQQQQIVRIDFDLPQHPVDEANYAAALERCDIVVFIDYGKGTLANIQPLIARARYENRAVLVDPKWHDYARYRGATMIKPNADTVNKWGCVPVLDCGFDSVLFTMGTQGMTLYAGEQMQHYPAENAHPVDVSGAGEAAISAYAAALAKGMPPLECARYASKAAGIACAHQGTYVVGSELWT